MLLLPFFSFALANYPATPVVFTLTPSVIQPSLINGNYSCPFYTTCYSPTGATNNCGKGSVCCKIDQKYSNGTCIDSVPRAACGLNSHCCPFNGICSVYSTCCGSSDFCTKINNSTATCVTGLCSTPNCGGICEECENYHPLQTHESFYTLAICVLVFGGLSLIVVWVNSTIKINQISRILRKFTPAVIAEVVKINPNYFDHEMKELIISSDFHEKLTTLQNHYRNSILYQPVVLITSLIYGIDQIIRYYDSVSPFATVSFSIFIFCLSLWAGRSIYIRYKLRKYLVAILKLDEARKELLKTVVSKVRFPPGPEVGAGGFLTF